MPHGMFMPPVAGGVINRRRRFVAAKGSICLNGVSLTVNKVDGLMFDVNIIPHTQAVTTLGELRVGDGVNVEIDVVARYLDRLNKTD